MKTIKSILFEDSFRFSGMIFILISAIIFGIGSSVSEKNNSELTVFFICYSITAVFTVATLFRAFRNHGWKIAKSKIEYTTLMLIFWLISAFAFNKEMAIFDNSTTWLSAYICIACTAVLFSTIQDHLSQNARHILSFFLGASLTLFLYYSIYLLPFYFVGILAAIFLGLSVHLFAPLGLSILILTISIRFIKITPVLKYSFLAGSIIPLLAFSYFFIQWINIQNTIKSVESQHTLNGSQLPKWASIAQQLPQSPITEKFLKADLVYTTPRNYKNWFWGDFGRNVFDEPKKHDPMVMASVLFKGKSDLTDEDRIHTLKSVFNSRHLAQERLWSGDDLITSNVISNIKIYPEYRMAYTEKTISIKNTDTRSWRNGQEAIYTFQLPDGSVISSLSLWINGIEEPARLTTKSKADSAYTQIVGIETRDPSVVHWQEGNQVTVRVFPCTTEEQRKFKIGITSPLILDKTRLTYQNASFSGPSPVNASESVKISFSTAPNTVNTDFIKSGNSYSDERTYENDWQLSLAQVPLSKAKFSFNGSSYQLKEAPLIHTNFKPTSIYLDINSSWSKEELRKIWSSIKAQKVYVFDDKLIVLSDKNIEQVFRKLHQLNFSLFPFHKIAVEENALVITKSTRNTPNLSDIEESQFHQRITNVLSKPTQIHLFNIEDSISPYLQTLNQFGVFKYCTGDLTLLISNLQRNRFTEIQEPDHAVTISCSGMMIQKSTEATDKNVPDHLLRLFAYNEILKRIGPSYFKKDYVNNDLVAIADQAFIVSPVSSLIVLETKKDYDRFDINQSKNSLKNASMKSSGAAPEPHEWMLIFLCGIVIIYFGSKSPYIDQLKLKWQR